jgi:hypothetical protein
MYLLFVGPERASHHGTHTPGAAERVEESPPEPVEGQPREESKATQVAAEKTAEAKSQGQETKRTKPELQNIPPSEVDEVCHLPRFTLSYFGLVPASIPTRKLMALR